MSVISKRIFKVSHLMKIFYSFFMGGLVIVWGYNYHYSYLMNIFNICFHGIDSTVYLHTEINRFRLLFFYFGIGTHSITIVVKCFEFRCFDHVDNNLSSNGIHSDEIYFQHWSFPGILWCLWLEFNQADDLKGVTPFSIQNDFIWSNWVLGFDLVTAW